MRGRMPQPWRAAEVYALEPVSYSGTCATEARWDAVLGGSRRRIDSMLGATDNEMRPDRPVGRLHRCPHRPYRHMAFVGRLPYGPSWPQRITGLGMKQVLEWNGFMQKAWRRWAGM